MELLAVILAVLLIVVPAIVGVLFVWAAVKDGEEDRALQKRLGIRRRTRPRSLAQIAVKERLKRRSRFSNSRSNEAA